MRSGQRRRLGIPLLVLGVAVLFVVGLLAVSAWLPSLVNPFDTLRVDRTQPAVLLALDDLSEYHAATGHFQVIVDVERDSQLPAFLQGERTLFVAGGTVDAVVDFDRLGAEDVRVSADRRAVELNLPGPRLSDPRVDPQRSYVYTRQRGLLDRVGGAFSDNPTTDRELYLLAEEKLAAAAAETELAQRAEANTRDMLETMFAALGFETVRVTFG
jgi:hypothetical protein